MKLYDFHDSGNGYKVRLLCALIGLDHDYREIDITRGESRTPEFLAKNPNGRIPVLELDDGTFLTESDAILHHLADGTSYLPADRLAETRVLQWMFFEQYNHEPSIAVARYIVRHTPEDHPRRGELPGLRERGHAALEVMEDRLSGHDWLVGDGPTIADIALFAYTHVAEDGGIETTGYPGIKAWMDRIRTLDGFVPMTGGRG